MHPIRSTGLRPIRSDRPPQYMPVHASAKEKAERQQKIVSSLGWCVFVAGVASLGFGALKLVRHSRFMN